MKKIPSLFVRDMTGDKRVVDQVVPDAQWVLDGHGVATRKWDGTCVLIEGDCMWRRYQVGAGKAPPWGFRPADEVDPITGKQQGWLLITDKPDDKWHRRALTDSNTTVADYPDGTYELVGPKIQGNPEGFDTHQLIPHGKQIIFDAPRTFWGLFDYLNARAQMGRGIEGIVWHHPDGRAAKIKTVDFGLNRNPERTHETA